jgi:hypothetical protein
MGYKVKPDMPGLKGPEVERLYARGAAWLAGAGRNRGPFAEHLSRSPHRTVSREPNRGGTFGRR